MCSRCVKWLLLSGFGVLSGQARCPLTRAMNFGNRTLCTQLLLLRNFALEDQGLAFGGPELGGKRVSCEGKRIIWIMWMWNIAGPRKMWSWSISCNGLQGHNIITLHYIADSQSVSRVVLQPQNNVIRSSGKYNFQSMLRVWTVLQIWSGIFLYSTGGVSCAVRFEKCALDSCYVPWLSSWSQGVPNRQ